MSGTSRPSLVITVDEPSKAGEARRRASELAAGLGFDDERRGRVALVVTEAVSNLIKHAGGGELVVQGWREGAEGSRLEVLALDRGPGMTDVSRCLTDGYSTVGSLGHGLGAMARMADDFGIYSAPELGTAVWAGFRMEPRPGTSGGPILDAGVVSLATPGEDVCGDDWVMLDRGGRAFLLVVDGLGHGTPAAQAAAAAVEVFRTCASEEPGEIIAAIHATLHATRGAALAIARVNPVQGTVHFAGVGNVAGVILDASTGRSQNMVSLNGTAGLAVRKIQHFEYAWTEESLLILHSDGLGSRWDLDRYPGLSREVPGLLAGVLYRDHRRGRDDVTVAVARLRRART
jgi:anti-sigma regulatory factor (Ser/Thr protein kinase)